MAMMYGFPPTGYNNFYGGGGYGFPPSRFDQGQYDRALKAAMEGTSSAE